MTRILNKELRFYWNSFKYFFVWILDSLTFVNQFNQSSSSPSDQKDTHNRIPEYFLMKLLLFLFFFIWDDFLQHCSLSRSRAHTVVVGNNKNKKKTSLIFFFISMCIRISDHHERLLLYSAFLYFFILFACFCLRWCEFRFSLYWELRFFLVTFFLLVEQRHSLIFSF